MHASHMQREEAGAEAIKGHKRSSDNVWGDSQPSLWEANGNPNSTSQANAIPF